MNAHALIAIVVVGCAALVAGPMAWKHHVVAAFWTFFPAAFFALVSLNGAR